MIITHIRFNIESAVIIRRPIYTLAITRKSLVPLLHASRTQRNVVYASCTRGGPGHREMRREYASVKSGKSRDRRDSSSRAEYMPEVIGRISEEVVGRAKRALNCPKERKTLNTARRPNEQNCGTQRIFVTRAFFSFFLSRRVCQAFLRGVEIENVGLTSNEIPDYEPDFYPKCEYKDGQKFIVMI